jgi:hypothetical protein
MTRSPDVRQGYGHRPRPGPGQSQLPLAGVVGTRVAGTLVPVAVGARGRRWLGAGRVGAVIRHARPSAWVYFTSRTVDPRPTGSAVIELAQTSSVRAGNYATLERPELLRRHMYCVLVQGPWIYVEGLGDDGLASACILERAARLD